MPQQATATSPRHRGWFFDQVNNRLAAVFNGTEVLDFDTNDMVVTPATTFSAASEFSAAVGVADDISIELGTDDDSVIRHRSATLSANTALTDVLIGTPVAQALEANSTIISNTRANGDIGIYVNTGANSEQAIRIDGSASSMSLGQTGWALNVRNGAVKLTLGTASAFASTQPTNTLVMRSGTAPAGAITTAGGLFSTDTVIQKIVAGGTVTNVET